MLESYLTLSISLKSLSHPPSTTPSWMANLPAESNHRRASRKGMNKFWMAQKRFESHHMYCTENSKQAWGEEHTGAWSQKS